MCATTGLPSWAQNKEVWGNRDAHVQSTATQRPRPQAIGARGASHLPLPSLLSQAQARLGPGGYCRRSGNGGTQTCLPAACGVAQGVAQYGPSSSTHAQDPRQGPSLAGRMTEGFLGHSLVRLAREEAERSRRGTSRGAHDASHDDQGQAGASARSVLISSLVLKRQAQAWSPED